MPLIILLVPIHAILLIVGDVLISPTDSLEALGICVTCPLGLCASATTAARRTPTIEAIEVESIEINAIAHSYAKIATAIVGCDDETILIHLGHIEPRTSVSMTRSLSV